MRTAASRRPDSHRGSWVPWAVLNAHLWGHGAQEEIRVLVPPGALSGTILDVAIDRPGGAAPDQDAPVRRADFLPHRLPLILTGHVSSLPPVLTGHVPLGLGGPQAPHFPTGRLNDADGAREYTGGSPFAEECVAQGRAAFEAGDFAAAVQAFSEGLAHAPAHVVLRNNRSAALQRLGRAEEALVDAGACLRIDPGFYKGWLRSGEALLLMGRRATAPAPIASDAATPACISRSFSGAPRRRWLLYVKRAAPRAAGTRRLLLCWRKAPRRGGRGRRSCSVCSEKRKHSRRRDLALRPPRTQRCRTPRRRPVRCSCRAKRRPRRSACAQLTLTRSSLRTATRRCSPATTRGPAGGVLRRCVAG